MDSKIRDKKRQFRKVLLSEKSCESLVVSNKVDFHRIGKVQDFDTNLEAKVFRESSKDVSV